jgi:hypothetical protein
MNMKMNKVQSANVLIVLTVFIAFLTLVHVMGATSASAQLSAGALPPGWQFYSNPTTLEPPGTVFRIDEQGRRYVVNILKVAPVSGSEAVGKLDRIIEVDATSLVRFWGVVGKLTSSGSGTYTDKLKFSMDDTVREVTTDVAIEDVIRNFAKKIAYKKNNRYFVIREAMSAKNIDYTLSEGILARVGGEGSLKAMLSGRGNVSLKKGKEYTLEQKFTQRMRVLFLPEEIVPAPRFLSGEGPFFETQPVKEILKWED